MKWKRIALGLALVSIISLAKAQNPIRIWDIINDLAVITFNRTGTINASEYVIAKEFRNTTGDLDWIRPENVFDIDDADIETDLNTYVDIAGDTMTNNLTTTGILGIGGYCLINTTPTNFLITNVGC